MEQKGKFFGSVLIRGCAADFNRAARVSKRNDHPLPHGRGSRRKRVEIFSFKSEAVRFIFVLMQKPDVLMRVIEKLNTQIRGNAQRRQSWLATQKTKYPDLSALKPELLAQETVLAPAVDRVCWTWVHTGKLPQIRPEDANTLGPFVWDRFFRGMLFAKYLHDGGCRIYGKGDEEVLTWLLVDSWRYYGRIAWKQSPAESL